MVTDRSMKQLVTLSSAAEQGVLNTGSGVPLTFGIQPTFLPME